ncbi:hypothetical protein CB1_001171004 [Camelus ferus]|nr:hypothetical protein CB1_001171004 [Camelus ferus]
MICGLCEVGGGTPCSAVANRKGSSFCSSPVASYQWCAGKSLVLTAFPPRLGLSHRWATRVNDHKRKQKVLGPNQKLKFNPTELIIYCKDFRIVRFRFDESGPESAKKALLRLEAGSQEIEVLLNLPEYFVVPSSLADQDLKIFSHSFVGRRMPFWCWSHANGSALVRMALIKDVLQQRKIDQRAFLKHSAELVYTLESKRLSVVLQEEEGRDLSCIVASLVQVMLDPYFRTITGFQSLIQKEWVMAGYQFLDRCNHLKRSEKESPLFLLFLDATWQLLEQCPAAFEFSEAYLAVLHDSTRVPLFGTFLFNCPHQRVKQSTFTAKDRTLFHNPLYIGKSPPCVQNGSAKSFKQTKHLREHSDSRSQGVSFQLHSFVSRPTVRPPYEEGVIGNTLTSVPNHVGQWTSP